MAEIERYELTEGGAYRFEPDRRDFFRLLGAGMFVFLAYPVDGTAQESGAAGRRGRSRETLPDDIAAWLHIGEDNQIRIYTGKTEVGQNIRTSLTQAVAEELSAPPLSIEMVMADTDLTPFDMGTFGSRTTPTMAPQLRRVAAAAREALLDLAAEKWNCERIVLWVSDGRVADKSGRSASFGELTAGKNLVKSVHGENFRRPRGESLAKVDGRQMVTGAHAYASDIKRPGMLYGRVLRPCAFGATLTSLDTKAAESLPGVTVVRDGQFAGVTARDSHTAEKALSATKADWKTVPQSSSKKLFADLRNDAGEQRQVTQKGSLDDAWSSAAHKVEATYTVAYIAHVPLEPRAAVAEWKGGRLTVWTGTQRPFGVRTELAQAFGIPETAVRVIVPDTGSGYGGKHTGECAIEAARLARTAGKPVKLVWTREEEFTWAYFRPAGVIDVRSSLDAKGGITGWEYHNFNSGTSGIETPYEIANQDVRFHESHSPLRQGSYRGLAATANHFARESHMDDLARVAGAGPLEFRNRHLRDERLKAVLAAAGERFDWGGKKPSAHHGFGLACGLEKGGYVASCAEVSVSPQTGRIKIERVATAFECGAIVNPEHLKNQVEGAVMMGIGGALFEGIEFENGKVMTDRLSRYRVPRFSDMPVLETVLLDRKDLPSAGAGETPIVTLAPAVRNAILDATGARLYSLPMRPDRTNDAADITALAR